MVPCVLITPRELSSPKDKIFFASRQFRVLEIDELLEGGLDNGEETPFDTRGDMLS